MPQKRNRPVLAVTMDPEIREQVELAAVAAHVTTSRWVEQIIRAELERRKRRATTAKGRK